MARTFATVKLNSCLVDAARAEAELFHRSLAGQIEHWASLGRALETADVSLERVRDALNGKLKIENLSDAEQDAFFANLGEAFEAPSQELKAGYAALGRKRKALHQARGNGRSAA